MNRIDRRQFLTLGTGACVVGAVGTLPRFASAATNITIAESQGHGWAIAYVADARDLWSQAGLNAEVARFTAGRLALEAVLAEKADFCTTTGSPTALAAMRGIKAHIVADFSRSNEMQVVARVDRDISAGSQLKGKRVATKLGTSGHYYLHNFLKLHELDISDVTLINMSPNDMVTATVRGDIDAFAWSWRAAQVAAEQGGDKVAVLEQEGLDDIWQNHLIMVTNQKVLDEKPDSIEGVVKTLFASEEFIRDNRDKALEIVSERTSTSVEATKTGFSLNDFHVKLDERLVMDLVDNAEWAIEAGMAKRPDTPLPELFRGIVYDKAIRAVRPDRVNL